MAQVLKTIDEGVYSWIAASPEKCFKTVPKDLEGMFKSLRKEPSKEGYCSTMRTKCTISEDKASFKCWNGNTRQPMGVEEIKRIDWPNSSFACEVLVKGVYFQANSFGPMLEVKNVMIRTEDDTCPFMDTSGDSDA